MPPPTPPRAPRRGELDMPPDDHSATRAWAEHEIVWVHDSAPGVPSALISTCGSWVQAEVLRGASTAYGHKTVPVRLFKLGTDGTWALSDHAPSGQVEVDVRVMRPSNFDRQDETDDLAQLSHLNAPCVLEHVRRRYLGAQAHHAAGMLPHGIYTRAGSVVVAVNPFTPVEGLYSDEQLRRYRDAAADSFSPSRTAEGAPGAKPPLPPHIFEVAARAFARVQRRECQSIVINGESGAGKTECTKQLLSYFARAAKQGISVSSTGSTKGQGGMVYTSNYGTAGSANSTTGGGGAIGALVSEQLMRTNPVLEAFGNAKTVRNDNSSRFGKLVTLHFRHDAPTELAYARVQQYLLEKTRVVGQARGEQAYHAFYHLALGAPAALKSELGLASPVIGSFAYLRQPVDARTGPGRAHAATDEFTQTHSALVSLGGGGTAGEATGRRFWRTLAGILHLGQIHFEDSSRAGEAALTDSTRPALTRAASLVEVADVCQLEYALCNRTIGGSRSPRTTGEATAARDALAKAFYEGLFDELVRVVNGALSPSGDAGGAYETPWGDTTSRNPTSAAGGGGGGGSATVGLLDIFGSEVFATNRFEQLLINYANDKLQNYFKQTTVGKVRELYEREQIGLKFLPSSEPPASLVLLEGPPPALGADEKLARLKVHFGLVRADGDAALKEHLQAQGEGAGGNAGGNEQGEEGTVHTLEQFLGVHVPEGRSLESRIDELFKSVFRTSLLQLLIDKGNYSDRATEREVKGRRLSLLDVRSPDAGGREAAAAHQPPSPREGSGGGSRRGSFVQLMNGGGGAGAGAGGGGASGGALAVVDERIAEGLATYCSKFSAYVTAGKFDNQPCGLTWRYALHTSAGGEWRKVGGAADRLNKAGGSPGHFGVRHFGSTVFYDVDAFAEKNNDYIDADLAKLVPHAYRTGGGGAGGGTGAGAGLSGVERKTVAGKFKSEMRKLVDETLAPSAGHFIRCIKPNAEQQRFKLDDAASIALTLSQLNCCGVLEAAQISAAGFPNRLDYADALHTFGSGSSLFRRHRRQQLAKPPLQPPADAATLKRRAQNLRARFPHATIEEATTLVTKHRGHAGRASRTLALAAARLGTTTPGTPQSAAAAPDQHLQSPGASITRLAVSGRKASVRQLLVDVYHLSEGDDFVLGRTLLFLRTNVLARLQPSAARLDACRERVGFILRRHEMHYRMWWNVLDDVRDKAKLELLKAGAARDEAARAHAAQEAEAAREEAHTRALAAAREDAAKQVREEMARAHAVEIAAMAAEQSKALDALHAELSQRASSELTSALAQKSAEDEQRLEALRAQLLRECEAKLAQARDALAKEQAAALQAVEAAKRKAVTAAEAQRAAEQTRHAAQVSQLRAAVETAAADQTAVRAAQAEARAALEAAQKKHERSRAEAHASHRAALQQLESQFEARLSEEVCEARIEEQRRQASGWHAHLVRALEQRDATKVAPTTQTAATVQGVAAAAMMEAKQPLSPSRKQQQSANVPAPTRTAKSPHASPPPGATGAPAAPALKLERRMTALQAQEAAELAEWRRTAQRAKEKEAHEVLHWIETARAAKAKEAAELAEWTRRAKAAKAAQGLK